MSDNEQMPGGGPTGAILIEIFPAGTPGKIVLQISDVGTVNLSVAEQIRTLHSAIEILENMPPD